MSQIVLEHREQQGRFRLPRPALKIWPALTFPLSAVIIWAINSGGEAWRWLALGGLASSMALSLVISLEAGLIAMMLFEPLRGFLRRAQYIFLPYSQTDPIHVVTPLVTILAFAMLLQRRRFAIFRQTPLAGPVSILAAIYVLQIFNPLQGGLTVGFSGALFMLVPVAWFYFGQTVKPGFLESVFKIVVVLGLLTSLYGVYQLIFGFPRFEQYWIDNTEFYNSISVGNVKRALATFSSAEEWGRYIEIGALIAFGFAASGITRRSRLGWLLSGGALSLMLLLTGQRTAMFGLILGCVVLMLTGARTWRIALGRLGLLLAPMLLIAVLVKAPTNDDMLSHGEDDKMGSLLSHTTRGTLDPTHEESLQERFKNWTFLATNLIPYRPFGLGIGATSLAAWRFNTDMDLPPIDSYFISTVITCGLPAALLFMWILMRAAKMSWYSFRGSEPGTRESRVWRVAASLMPVLFLNSIFGNTFTLYSVAPVGWLLVGWISAQHSPRAEQRELIEI
jgi:hypothetical protein